MKNPSTNSESKRSTVELSVIVISYNTRQLTLKAIETLIENTATEFEVIVLDNASDDGSADAIEHRFPEIQLIQSKENLGFAQANNIAAIEAKGKYLLLLNPDTEVLPGAIDELLRFAIENPGARIWGGSTVFSDSSPNPTSCWQQPTVWSLLMQASGLTSLARSSTFFNPERVALPADGSPVQVDIVSGCMLLIELEFFRELHGFSPEFFMYGEDADLCLRAHSFGARPMILPSATIVHHGGASEKVPADKLVRLMTAKMQLIRRHISGAKGRICQTLLAAWPFSRMIAHRIAAALGRRESNEKANTWTSVWARRIEWR